MSEAPTQPPTGRRGPRRVLRWAAAAVAVLLVAVLASGYAIWRHLDRNLDSEDTQGRTGVRPSAAATPTAGESSPLNILLVGSDSREDAADRKAAGGFRPESGGARSDTTIVLHVSADRTRALAVSIPRDSYVPIPSCTNADGSTTRAEPGAKFNAAFENGGIACTIKEVQQLTGVPVDHYVVVDFSGFETVVDALGGVPVCLQKSVDDTDSGLVLSAGRHVVTGAQALAFVRVRHIGDGTDLARISRQQAFLSGLVQKATSTGTLTNPVKLYDFLDAATKSVTTDPDLASIGALTGLARQLRGIDHDRIRFVTVPNRFRADGANVVWTSDADPLWAAVRDDTPLAGTVASTPAPTTPSTASASAGASAGITPSASTPASATPSATATITSRSAAADVCS